VAVPPSRDAELNSVVEILKSRAMAEKVVDAVGPEFVLSPAASAESNAEAPSRVRQFIEPLQRTLAQGKELVRNALGRAKLTDRQAAVEDLLGRFTVAPTKRSELVQIECKGPSPEWAQMLVGKLIEVYQTEHIKLNNPSRAMEFFAEQTARAKQDLTERQRALQDLKSAAGIVSSTEQRIAFAARISRLEEEAQQSQAAVLVSQSRVDSLRKQLSDLPAEQVESVATGYGNEGTDQMRSQLYQLEVRKEEASAKYTDAHPAMQAINDQLKASRAVASKEEPTRTHITKGRSRIYQDTLAALVQEQVLLKTTQARVGVLNEQLATLRERARTINEQDIQIAGLEREIDVCQTTVRKYAAGLEQAKIDQARELQKISNISVAQPATFEPQAVSPKPSLFLAGGAFFGLLAAVAVAYWADARNHAFREAEEIERRLQIPVLASIPTLPARPAAMSGDRR
jgi:uncharacterized protein involved in exopolysaccharide biosynthesis